ncbi:hypothetical protein ABZ511_21730 [Nocardia gamkensis]|uniref:hypothetical protein n=1 Tax=Nocardia TaxID=1817 RepID=UPI0034118487
MDRLWAVIGTDREIVWRWAMAGHIPLTAVDDFRRQSPIERDFVDGLLLRLSGAHLDDGTLDSFTVPVMLYSRFIREGCWSGERVLPKSVTGELARLALSSAPSRPVLPAQATEFMVRIADNPLPREAALTIRAAIFASRISEDLVHPIVGAQRWPTPMAEYDEDSPAAATMRQLPSLVDRWLHDVVSRDSIEAEVRRLAAAHRWR